MKRLLKKKIALALSTIICISFSTSIFAEEIIGNDVGVLEDSVNYQDMTGIKNEPETLDETKQDITSSSNRVIQDKDNIPVLMYHHFVEGEHPAGDGATMSIDEFDSHMKVLLDNGYTTISLEELNTMLLDAAESERNGEIDSFNFGEKYICITIDDGYRSNYELAYNIIKKYNIKASISVIVSRIHNDYVNVAEVPKMSWDNLNEMQESGLVMIYNHSMYHKGATQSTLPEFISSVKDGEDILDDKLTDRGLKVFTYPYGTYSFRYLTTVRNLGYSLQLTTDFGVVNKYTSINEIPRITVSSGTTGERLLEIIEEAKAKTFTIIEPIVEEESPINEGEELEKDVAYNEV